MFNRRRRIRRFVVLTCVLAIAAVIAGLPVYVRPQTDPLRHADAIVVLGGSYSARYTLGIDLASEGWAPTVVLSTPEGRRDRWLTNKCANPPLGITVHCLVPDPPTTKGEAQELRRLATQYGWRTIIAVTFRPHISRARYILEQCFDGALVMVASPARMSVVRWTFEYVYQTAGYVRAVLQPGC
jgi:uncharacterized SAM-binding protein YcdF (DUF218 family)